jgi:hypothetical protein
MRLPPTSDERQTLIPGATPNNTITDANQKTFDSGYSRLRWLMLVTAITHTISAGAITGLYIQKSTGDSPTMGKARVERIASCWNASWDTDSTTGYRHRNDTFITITNKVSTTAMTTRTGLIAANICIFFIFSAVFQFWALIRGGAHKTATITNAPQWHRYIEYSITASCMMVTIFLAIGLLEVYLHVTIFLLTALCMFAGLLADYMRHLSSLCVESVATKIRGVMGVSTYIGWLCMMTPWAIVFVAFHDLQYSTFADVCETPVSDLAGDRMPWWVLFIIIGEFGLFNAFGGVQLYQLKRQFYINPFKWNRFLAKKEGYDEPATGLLIETLFVALSLSSKTLLGWLLFTQILAAN